MMKRKVGLAIAICFSLCFAACGAKEDQKELKQDTTENKLDTSEALKPGEEGFTFQYVLPKDITPLELSEKNAMAAAERMEELDKKQGNNVPQDYYQSAIGGVLQYAYVPGADFWNVNPEMPQELYQLPVNIMADGNSGRMLSGREFAEYNGDKLPYYYEVGRYMIQNIDNCDYQDLEEYKTFSLMIRPPFPDVAANVLPMLEKDCEQMKEKKVIVQAAYISDESLIYLASDGNIRLRGLLLIKYQSEEKGTEYQKYFNEISFYPTEEETKTQPFTWEFTDFYCWNSFDILQVKIIDETEFNRLLEQYQVSCEWVEKPEWLGTYGKAVPEPLVTE